jgi:hypothetical protein
MTTFEYLLVLISIIVGLGIAHILSGVGRIISHPSRQRVYWIHLLWVAWAFAWLILFWWAEFQRSMTEAWTPAAYVFLILFAVILYLFCVILLPRETPDGADYRQYYYSRRRWIFALFIGVMLMNLIENMTFLDSPESTTWAPVLYLAVVCGPALIAAISTKERFHAALGVIWVWVTLRELFWGGFGPHAVDGMDPSQPMWSTVVEGGLSAVLVVAALSVFIRPLDSLLSRLESRVLKRHA